MNLGNVFGSVLSALKAAALTLETPARSTLSQQGSAVIPALETTGGDALKGVETVVGKYLPLALQQAEKAATDPGLVSGSAKRDAVLSALTDQLKQDGHNAEADGVQAALSLTVELAVNIGKAILPNLFGLGLLAL